MKKYQQQIGDGKLPNKYFVFHYDEKAKLVKDQDMGGYVTEFPDKEAEGGWLGTFSSFEKALDCVDNKAYLPHVVIEDRITGVIWESYFEVCECCGHEDYKTIDDTGFTRKKLGNDFI